MISRRSQMNQTFVYVFSVIIIVFAAFLVIKFVLAFTSDTSKVAQSKFFDDFEKNLGKVSSTVSSEEVFSYKVSNNMKVVCFISEKGCVDTLDVLDGISLSGKESVKALFDAGDTIVLFNENDVETSKEIKGFSAKDGCFCVEPDFGVFKLLIQNVRNKVFVSEVK